MHQSPSPHLDTHEHILDVAGAIFAENGFHATTVRQITRKAGVNLAAVNYHFHDKHELYLSALKRAHHAAAKTAEADLAGTPEQRLRAFIHKFLGFLLDPHRPEWHGVLIARELAQPTQALDRLVAESIEPVRQRIVGIVREILGPGAAKTQVSLSALSIIGQCLHYVHCRETISRLFPKGSNVYRDVELLTEHIFQFSIAGLKALRTSAKSTPRRTQLASK